MPTWPASLPQAPLRSGLQLQPKPNVIAFGTEVGPGKFRRRTTARIKSYAARFLVTEAQRVTFVSFFENDLGDGALSFTMDDPAGGAAESWRFDAQSPYALTTVGAEYWELTVKLDRQP